MLRCLYCLWVMDVIFSTRTNVLEFPKRLFSIFPILFFLPVSLPCHTHSPHARGCFLSCQKRVNVLISVNVGACGFMLPPPRSREMMDCPSVRPLGLPAAGTLSLFPATWTHLDLFSSIRIPSYSWAWTLPRDGFILMLTWVW